MYDENSFYLTLPSDASMDKFSDNNSACWTTKLRKPVCLRGKWEVCLSELHYMQSMYTLASDQMMYLHYVADAMAGAATIVVPAGIYTSSEKLIQCISEQIPNLEPFKLDLNATTFLKAFRMELQPDRRVCISFPSARVKLYFDKDSTALQTMLGFDMDQDKFIPTIEEKIQYAFRDFDSFPIKRVGRLLINLRVGLQSLYVYCNVADYGPVGDSLSQILRTVPIRGGPMDVITERFDIGHYVPLLLTTFENIRIELANDLGELAKFHAGKSMVKLHFRRYKPY